MKLLNVLTKKQFDNNGATTTLWHKVGVIKITAKGGWFLQLFQQPDTDFYVFEEKDKTEDIQFDAEEISE